jgi:protein-disulfide isomerase-like protein with CxxC motif
MLGGLFGGQGNQASQGCHGHHHHHDHNNLREAAQDFRMAREDYRDAQQNFAQGNVFGGLSELAEARQHEADGFSHLSGGRGWI